MASNEERFEVEYTEECIEEMTEIYNYISTKLKNNNAAKRLISKVNENILSLSKFPEIYMKIGKTDKLSREYHRMVINNYIVLYTINYSNKKVYISRMIYGRRNYLT